MDSSVLNCPICSAPQPTLLDEREHVPIAQNLMYRDRDAAVNCPQGHLRVVRCMACGFAWNSAFDPALLKYDEDYENNQSLSSAFDGHLDKVARLIRDYYGKGGNISAVEIGCGQGYFFSRLERSFEGRITSLLGFDPAYRIQSKIPEIAHVEQDFFNRETCKKTGIAPDLIVTRHVIEHIADPLEFLRTIRGAARTSTVIAIETPNLQWILDGAIAHDLYYEHCSLFDAASLRFAMELTGFENIEITEQFDGQYLLAFGRAGNSTHPKKRAVPPSNVNYVTRRIAYVDRWRQRVSKDVADGKKVALWGGASKGVTFALILGDHCSKISAAIDINPVRSGSFMPLTGLPVITPEAAHRGSITMAYVLNPLYLSEIRQYCLGVGWELKLYIVD